MNPLPLKPVQPSGDGALAGVEFTLADPAGGPLIGDPGIGGNHRVMTVQLGVRSTTGTPPGPTGAALLYSHWMRHRSQIEGSVLLVQVFGAGAIDASDLDWLDLFASLGGRAVVVEARVERAWLLGDLPVEIWQLPSPGPVLSSQVCSAGEQISFDGCLFEDGDLVAADQFDTGLARVRGAGPSSPVLRAC